MGISFKRITMLSMSVVLSAALAACSSGSGSTEAESTPTTPQQDAGGPLTKYDPPIKLRSTMNETGKETLAEGDSHTDNIWLRGYKDELGIEVTYDWVVADANYNDKMNVTLASGDLPDVLKVSAVQFEQLHEAGMLEDLTEVYDKYASDLVKEFLSAEDGAGLKPVTKDGKIYAMVSFPGSLDSSDMIWIRQDWLKNVGLDAPQSMQDVIEIAEAFTFKDPDGNGKQDTFGIALNKDLPINGFLLGYHGYLETWIKDESGQVVNGTIQPEVKEGLQELQRLYKDGVIDPEFGVKDFAKMMEDVNAGKSGMFFLPQWAPFQVSGMIKNDPNVDWLPYPVQSIDDQPAKTQNHLTLGGIFAVRKGYEHPEALIKLLNFQAEKMFGEAAETERADYLNGMTGLGFQNATVSNLPANKNVQAQDEVEKALESGDTSGLGLEAKLFYDDIMDYRSGNLDKWHMERIFGPESSQGVIKYYRDNDLIVMNEFIYAPTKTMNTKSATLDKLRAETFLKIIYGNLPIDEFDNFVANWKKLGGDEITKEVNELINASK
ncbi:extracellular solute-binding protein [Paenibacillus urinalis]|uniref:Extracellular solute-binding protein n=1 Tax=Paenibacillus urinalis TaxID=521520 RepID=A0AAX3N433_9BACL|nr:MULTISPECIES: extracellular solute-binding protein [Paenibacillus]WDH84595.1 extracellular solute-binding protein [Paenibacillus urinalis]WDH96058.1 extracellular solute-binding protein [Paenibacillus urinalis]WDI04278.1 extracellular solute-binding protein [Paenibacillus urinalis]GAK38392.1 ABC transporter substrate-binding protein [Paenibacillus sp. TCA20]